MNPHNRCPRCEAPRLKSWSDLTAEEREVVKRLPTSAESSLAERQAAHRWCTRCWYEQKKSDQQQA